MVFFTCNHCGSALKKNKVEKHYAVECRKPPAVACMDCLKDFYGQEYVSHTRCITEEQKYSGKPIDGKSQLGKGERKQMEWVDTVRQIVETKGSSLTSQVRQLLESLVEFENIPRKKKKFENFLKNAMGRYVDPRTIEKVWSLLEEQKSEVANNKVATDGKEVTSPKEVEDDQQEKKGGGKKKKDKSSISEETEELMDTDQNTDGKEVISPKEVEDDQLENKGGGKKKKNKTSISEETEERNDTDQNSQKEITPKLSKKEKKEKKKKEKYELELKSISKEKQGTEEDKSLGEENMELDQEEIEDKCVKSKKSKKKKKDKVEEEPNAEENIEAAVINGTKNSEKKKKGKRKHAGDEEKEGGDKKRKKGVEEQLGEVNGENAATKSDVNGVDAEEVKGKRKFKWDKTIVSVLKSVPENELLVKRLRKKVLSEYQEALEGGRCQDLTLEEAMGMFERKLHKIPGVKVHKEKAKLVKVS